MTIDELRTRLRVLALDAADLRTDPDANVARAAAVLCAVMGCIDNKDDEPINVQGLHYLAEAARAVCDHYLGHPGRRRHGPWGTTH